MQKYGKVIPETKNWQKRPLSDILYTEQQS